MKNQKDKSIIDQFFNDLYGWTPQKEGAAFELLTAAALKILQKEKEVKYDQRIKGTHSDVVHQVDSLLTDTTGNEIMVENKDYSKRGDKVGYSDIAKLQGTMTDLNVKEGFLVSATDFTNVVKKYAKGTTDNEEQKSITLCDVRPSTKEDEKNRVKEILCRLTVVDLDFDNAVLSIQFSTETHKEIFNDLKSLCPNNQESITIKEEISSFYDKQGNVIKTLKEITKSFSLEQKGEKDVFEGIYEMPDAYTYIQGKLYPCKGLLYKIPVIRYTTSFSVTKDGKPILLVKSSDGKINKLLTDEELRNVSFNNGKVEI